jgi:hypothetical protein
VRDGCCGQSRLLAQGAPLNDHPLLTSDPAVSAQRPKQHSRVS